MKTALITEDGELVDANSGTPIEGGVGFLPNTILALEPMKGGGFRIKGVVGVRASQPDELRAAWRDAMDQKLTRLKKRAHWFEKLKRVEAGEQVGSYQKSTIRQTAAEVENEIRAYNGLAEEYGLPLLEVELPSWT
jgi:hypothetical protein